MFNLASRFDPCRSKQSARCTFGSAFVSPFRPVRPPESPCPSPPPVLQPSPLVSPAPPTADPPAQRTKNETPLKRLYKTTITFAVCAHDLVRMNPTRDQLVSLLMQLQQQRDSSSRRRRRHRRRRRSCCCYCCCCSSAPGEQTAGHFLTYVAARPLPSMRNGT